ncbi:unnamed protein product [Phytophthora fragariaefolia]|uniref:Unnamed protein product n=1 Tax=Phytophthora fragariaefolia TaxID=1490495 RepID=A0A9W7D196_9STRA|nr:unnamed protein product [Phytophthora fragariaefolia]
MVRIRECPLTAFDIKSELCELDYHVIKSVAEQRLDLAEEVVAASVGAVEVSMTVLVMTDLAHGTRVSS